MVIFLVRGEVDSDRFIKHCYSHYRNSALSSEDLPKDVEIIRNKGVKPILSTDKVRFSLSHSHGVCVVAMAESEIGADIEKIRDIDYTKFSFVKADNSYEFFERWTEKEAYLKYTGEGLGGLKKNIPDDAHFEHFDVFEDYHLCVCAEKQPLIGYELDINSID